MFNICIVGNDPRMDYVCECLFDYGYDVYKNEFDEKFDIVILEPVLSDEFYEKIYKIISNNTVVYYGKAKADFIKFLESNNIKKYNYLEFDDLVAENAELTALGIIKEALEDSAVIEESSCLVLGYGFCGKAIVKELKKYHANIDVLIRNRKISEELYLNNIGFIDLNKIDYNHMNKYSYVFNTIPAIVVDEKLLRSFSENVMIYDISSKPGGVDFDSCKKNNIFVRHSLGIPGKYYPKQAGYVIGDSIHLRLSNVNPPN